MKLSKMTGIRVEKEEAWLFKVNGVKEAREHRSTTTKRKGKSFGKNRGARRTHKRICRSKRHEKQCHKKYA